MEASIRQAHIANVLRDLVSEIADASISETETTKLTLIAARYAWGLYTDIQETSGKSPVSLEMEARTGTPGDPEYFEAPGAIREFLDCLDGMGKPYGTH